jgi:hypothetical protein
VSLPSLQLVVGITLGNDKWAKSKTRRRGAASNRGPALIQTSTDGALQVRHARPPGQSRVDHISNGAVSAGESGVPTSRSLDGRTKFVLRTSPLRLAKQLSDPGGPHWQDVTGCLKK